MVVPTVWQHTKSMEQTGSGVLFFWKAKEGNYDDLLGDISKIEGKLLSQASVECGENRRIDDNALKA